MTSEVRAKLVILFKADFAYSACKREKIKAILILKEN